MVEIASPCTMRMMYRNIIALQSIFINPAQGLYGLLWAGLLSHNKPSLPKAWQNCRARELPPLFQWTPI